MSTEKTDVAGAHAETCDKPVAFVTGGAQGIGYGITEALLKANYKVFVTDINEEKGRKSVEDLKKKYAKPTDIVFAQLDVTDNDQFTKAYEEAIRVFQRVDVLVNNAGILCENETLKTIMVNLTGTVYGCQIALKYMGIKNGGKGGTVINVASMVGLLPCPFLPVYTASKHGVVGLTRSYGSPEVFRIYGVHFTAICPSLTDTPLLQDMESNIFPCGKFSLPEYLDISLVTDGVLKLLNDRRNGSTLLLRKKNGYQYVGLGELENTNW